MCLNSWPSERVMEKQHDNKSWKTSEPLKFNINDPRIIRWSEFLWWNKKKTTGILEWKNINRAYTLQRLEICGLKQPVIALSAPWCQYKFRDVAVEELQKIHRIFPGMTASTGTYSGLFLENILGSHFCRRLSFAENWLLLLSISAYSDSTQKDLMKLIGNLPVQYEGESGLWYRRCTDGKFLACHVWDHYYVLMIASPS